MNNSDKQKAKVQSAKNADRSMEETKNQNHSSKKEGLGPNTKR